MVEHAGGRPRAGEGCLRPRGFARACGRAACRLAEGTVPGYSRVHIRAASYLKEKEGTAGLIRCLAMPLPMWVYWQPTEGDLPAKKRVKRAGPLSRLIMPAAALTEPRRTQLYLPRNDQPWLIATP